MVSCMLPIGNWLGLVDGRVLVVTAQIGRQPAGASIVIETRGLPAPSYVLNVDVDLPVASSFQLRQHPHTAWRSSVLMLV